MVRPMALGERSWTASTPSPSRVIRISLARTSPCALTINNRVELVPQSMAATGPCSSGGIVLLHDIVGAIDPELPSRPPAHGVVPSGEEPCDVGVQALDPSAGPADPSRRPWAEVAFGDRGVAFEGVTRVSRRDLVRFDHRVSCLDPSRSLQAANRFT